MAAREIAETFLRRNTHLVLRRVGDGGYSLIDPVHIVWPFQHVVQLSRDRVVNEPNQRGDRDVTVDCV